MKRTILLDGDTWVFSACVASEYVCEWTEDLHVLSGHLEQAKAHFDDEVSVVMEQLGGDELVVALSCYDHPRWRNAVMPSYKASRGVTRKPLIMPLLRQYVRETRTVYEKPGLEGDDILGILATHRGSFRGTEKVIVSIDKDLRTIPGLFCDYTKVRNTGEWDVEAITVEAADAFLWKQALMGDRTDGYPGCPGVGEKTAEKILRKARGKEWEVIVATYKEKGLTEEDALQNARVARILRAEDWDFHNGRMKLWNPQTS